MMNKLILLIIVAGITGCGEYIPRTVFEIKTVDGRILKLACPVVDLGRSELTYLIDGDCVAVR